MLPCARSAPPVEERARSPPSTAWAHSQDRRHSSGLSTRPASCWAPKTGQIPNVDPKPIVGHRRTPQLGHPTKSAVVSTVTITSEEVSSTESVESQKHLSDAVAWSIVRGPPRWVVKQPQLSGRPGHVRGYSATSRSPVQRDAPQCWPYPKRSGICQARWRGSSSSGRA